MCNAYTALLQSRNTTVLTITIAKWGRLFQSRKCTVAEWGWGVSWALWPSYFYYLAAVLYLTNCCWLFQGAAVEGHTNSTEASIRVCDFSVCVFLLFAAVKGCESWLGFFFLQVAEVDMGEVVLTIAMEAMAVSNRGCQNLLFWRGLMYLKLFGFFSRLWW